MSLSFSFQRTSYSTEAHSVTPIHPSHSPSKHHNPCSKSKNRESIFLLPIQVTIQDTRIRLSSTKKPEITAVNKNKNVADLKAKFELREAGTWFVLDAAFGLRVM